MFVMRSIVASLLLMLVAALRAQGPVADVPEVPTFLLRYDQVRKDINLSPAAAERVGKMEAASRARIQALMKPGKRPDMKAFTAESLRSQKEIAGVLTAPQRARLKQIGYQFAGPFSLLTPKVDKQLNLSEAQRKKLKATFLASIQRTQKEVSATMPKQTGGFANRPTPEAASTMARIRIAETKKLAAETAKILTPAQNKRWQGMLGKPFPLEILYAPYVPMGGRPKRGGG